MHDDHATWLPTKLHLAQLPDKLRLFPQRGQLDQAQDSNTLREHFENFVSHGQNNGQFIAACRRLVAPKETLKSNEMN